RRDDRDAEQGEVGVKSDRQDGAERRPRGNTERLRRGEWISQQRLKYHAGQGETAADDRRREDARQTSDEENLRVDVVGERDGPVEYARQPDGRAADQRRQEAHDGGDGAEQADGRQ